MLLTGSFKGFLVSFLFVSMPLSSCLIVSSIYIYTLHEKKVWIIAKLNRNLILQYEYRVLQVIFVLVVWMCTYHLSKLIHAITITTRDVFVNWRRLRFTQETLNHFTTWIIMRYISHFYTYPFITCVFYVTLSRKIISIIHLP